MTGILLLTPLLLALPVLFFRKRIVFRAALLTHAGVAVVAVILLWLGVDVDILPAWMSGYLEVDALSLYFLSLMTVVYGASAVYSSFYFREKKFQPFRESAFTAGMLLFPMSMTAVILSTHLAFLWVFLEMSTLITALLINHDRTRSALEAAWKYLFICSIGITLAFVGIILLSLGSREIGSLYFRDLIAGAGRINLFWLKMSFAFILVGFGTKIGVAPIHAWLPDAHSEAPSPVSALLSGALLNAALLGFIRFYQIIMRTEAASFAQVLTLSVGFLSMIIAASFMLKIVNYKRMLAYSSIENMGIIFIGLGLGGGGLFAAMLHTAAHSLSKTALFLTSGNILHLFGSKRVSDVKGLLEKSPATGWIWILSFLAISGMPPFPAFLSKFLTVKTFFDLNGWLAVLFLGILVVIFYGMGSAVVRMTFGRADAPEHESIRIEPGLLIPQIVLLILALVIGVSIPGPVRTLIQNAVALIHE